MEKAIKISLQILTISVLVLICHTSVAMSKKNTETDRTSSPEIVEEPQSMVVNFFELDEQEIAVDKDYLTPVDGKIEKRIKYVERIIPVRMQLQGHDLVWHYFIESISISYPVNDSSLHLFEVL